MTLTHSVRFNLGAGRQAAPNLRPLRSKEWRVSPHRCQHVMIAFTAFHAFGSFGRIQGVSSQGLRSDNGIVSRRRESVMLYER
jgi:hypothetical protein